MKRTCLLALLSVFCIVSNAQEEKFTISGIYRLIQKHQGGEGEKTPKRESYCIVGPDYMLTADIANDNTMFVTQNGPLLVSGKTYAKKGKLNAYDIHATWFRTSYLDKKWKMNPNSPRDQKLDSWFYSTYSKGSNSARAENFFKAFRQKRSETPLFGVWQMDTSKMPKQKKEIFVYLVFSLGNHYTVASPYDLTKDLPSDAEARIFVAMFPYVGTDGHDIRKDIEVGDDGNSLTYYERDIRQTNIYSTLEMEKMKEFFLEEGLADITDLHFKRCEFAESLSNIWK